MRGGVVRVGGWVGGRRWQVEEALKHVLPFGWERAWKAGEQENQQDEGHYVYRLTDSKGRQGRQRSKVLGHAWLRPRPV